MGKRHEVHLIFGPTLEFSQILTLKSEFCFFLLKSPKQLNAPLAFFPNIFSSIEDMSEIYISIERQNDDNNFGKGKFYFRQTRRGLQVSKCLQVLQTHAL